VAVLQHYNKQKLARNRWESGGKGVALEGLKLRSECGGWQVGFLWAGDLPCRPGRKQKHGSCKSTFAEERYSEQTPQ